MAFARFMASRAGRLLRIAGGLAMIVVGIGTVGGTAGWILAVAGLPVLLSGVLNFCFLAALFGGPFWGKDLAKPA